jgi:hypothetical protein
MRLDHWQRLVVTGSAACTQRTQRAPEFVREKGTDQMNMVPIDVIVDNRERSIAHWISVVGVAMTNGATGTDETKSVDGEPTTQSVQ